MALAPLEYSCSGVPLLHPSSTPGYPSSTLLVPHGTPEYPLSTHPVPAKSGSHLRRCSPTHPCRSFPGRWGQGFQSRRGRRWRRRRRSRTCAHIGPPTARWSCGSSNSHLRPTRINPADGPNAKRTCGRPARVAGRAIINASPSRSHHSAHVDHTRARRCNPMEMREMHTHMCARRRHAFSDTRTRTQMHTHTHKDTQTNTIHHRRCRSHTHK